MEPEEIRRQCRMIHQSGWGGAFLHARIGLRTEYLGTAWFAACEAAIDECRQLGLKVWFYDEEGWPSGISGGTVPLANEAYRQKTLFARPVNSPAPERSMPIGSPQNGLQIYHWTAPLGSWRFNGACYADLLSREAMQAFLQDAYVRYHERFSADYGKTVVAEFLDEPCAVVHVNVPAGSLPFTPALFDAFLADHGYDVRPHLHTLFTDTPDSSRIRIHYARTASKLFEVNFTKQLADWCSAHQISLTGHYMEGNLYDQQCLGNSIAQNYRHQQIPGIDHLCMQVSEIITAKQCHGVVNQYAKSHMLCEAYGAAGQNLSFADRWWIGIHLISLGVTLFTPHLSLYTLAGCRKRDFPPNLFFQQPWWPANSAVDEPLTRLCVAMAQGKAMAEALVIHPQESAAALLRVRTDWINPDSLEMNSDIATPEAKKQIERLDADFQATVRTLLGAQRTFDLGDETILAAVGSVAQKEDGTWVLRVGAMDYPAVIIPSILTLAETTFELLKKFQSVGGLILLSGDVPTLVEGRPSTEIQSFLASCSHVSNASLTNQLPQPLVSLQAKCDVSDTFVQVRILPDGDRLVFLADRRRVGQPIHATLHVAGDFTSIFRLGPHTGKETPFTNTTTFPLTLHPASAHLFRISAQPLTASLQEPVLTQVPTELVLPASDWKVERIDDNALVLDNATWRESTFNDFTSQPIPVLAIQGRLDALRYTGALTLRYTFHNTNLSPARKVHLVVEYAERYHFTVNGSSVERVEPSLPNFLNDYAFKQLDITNLVKQGDNTIELHLSEFIFADPLATRENQSARTGTEIEAIYLVGDFHLSSQHASPEDCGPNPITEVFPFGSYINKTLPPIPLSYLAADSLTLVEPTLLKLGDVVPQGLPFYAGRLRLSTVLPQNLGSTLRTLRLVSLDASVADVEADGLQLGHLFAEPLQIDLPPEARTLTLTLYSSLRNLLGPHHHVSGEPVNTAPWFYIPHCGEGECRAANTLAWSQGTYQSPNHRYSYACVTFGRTGVISLNTC